MLVNADTYRKMPPELRDLFRKAPNNGSEEVLGLFPEAPSCGRYTNSLDKPKTPNRGVVFTNPDMGSTREQLNKYAGDTGSAARFFTTAKFTKEELEHGDPGSRLKYCAKASRRDRGEGNVHPCVKPTALMRWLCRLITPPGGTILDPFMGSGSTGKAAVLEGFSFIGIEREEEYLRIARARIAASGARVDDSEVASVRSAVGPPFEGGE